MTALQDREALEAAQAALAARHALTVAEEAARARTMRYIDRALDAGWNWTKIAEQLANTPTGVRRYYQRNRRRVHGGRV